MYCCVSIVFASVSVTCLLYCGICLLMYLNVVVVDDDDDADDDAIAFVIVIIVHYCC